ncbi:MAG TPA: glycosyltransferase [Phycicoccus sp.]|nr:glycosyltransferase [Phycicoccus sp.]
MSRVVLAANNGEVGGGEVMLLATAQALRDLGVDVQLVGPSTPDGVLDHGARLGFEVTRLPGDRRAYLARLRGWSAGQPGWMWCHGLVPSLATAGRPRRIVHLHQGPARLHAAAVRIARRGAAAVLVPSQSMARTVPGAEVLWNWSAAQPGSPPHRSLHEPVRVGFIGRHSADKGLHVLAGAVRRLEEAQPGRWRLVLAGDDRFVPEDQRRRVAHALDGIDSLTSRLGWCDRAAFFAAVDVAAFPSTWAEPFGLVATEAMSARVPCVVSDAGALPEVLGPAHPWVARAGDVEDLATVVRRCAEASPGDRQAVVERAHARWERYFSPDAGRERVASLVTRLGVLT